MKLFIDRIKPGKLAPLMEWLLEQDELRDDNPKQPRFQVTNFDRQPVDRHTLERLQKNVSDISSIAFYSTQPEWGVPVSFTIVGEDDILAWIKLKFL